MSSKGKEEDDVEELVNDLMERSSHEDVEQLVNDLRMIMEHGGDYDSVKECIFQNYTENTLSPDVRRMLAAGLPYNDIKNLCLASKEWNRTVCNNQDFYKALIERGDIFQATGRLPNVNAIYRTIQINDIPLITFGHDNDGQHSTQFMFSDLTSDPYRRAIQGMAHISPFNTVTIVDEGEEIDLVWYYFFWAPRNNKYVNYSKKWTDEEIISDLKYDDELREHFTWPPPLGLSMKRLNILLFNKGIATVNMNARGKNMDRRPPGAEHLLSADGIIDIIENQNLQPPYGFISLHDAFNLRHPNFKRFFARILARFMVNLLRPAFEDLAVDYYFGPCFALTATMQNPENPKIAFDELILKYNVEKQLDNLATLIRNGRRDGTLTKREKTFCSHLHKRLNRLGKRKLLFPFRKLLWSDTLIQKMANLEEAARLVAYEMAYPDWAVQSLV